jgi:hypothetical protein
MSIEPSFAGEVQFAGYSDSSKSGPRITLRLSARENLEAFVGKEGKRFMLALVEVGDDEQPVQQPKAPAAQSEEQPKGGELSRLAAMWCQREDFQNWCAEHFPYAWQLAMSTKSLNPERKPWEAARLVILDHCGVDSRSKLDHDERAAQQFHEAFRIPFSDHLRRLTT